MSEPSTTTKNNLTPTEAAELPPLTAFENELLAAVEQFRYVHGRILSVDEFVRKTKLDAEDVERTFNNPVFKQALVAKGLLVNTPIPSALTAEQVAIINMVVTKEDTRTFREKLKSMNIPVNKWNGWLTQKEFNKYLEARSGVNFNSLTHTAFKTIANAMENGDLAATKMYLEMQNLYAPKLDVSININVFMQGLIDAITKIVPDEYIEEIANAIDTLYNRQLGKSSNLLETVLDSKPIVVDI